MFINNQLNSNHLAQTVVSDARNFNSQKEIKNLWLIKAVGIYSILEIRAIKGKEIIIKTFKGSSYENTDDLKQAFEDEALKLNEQGYNIYIVMNPIKESFTGYSASDDDIEYRDLLLIDIDRSQKSEGPANQAELDAALALANDITKYLKSQSWDKPILVMSGNGYHLYYVLNKLPNDIKHKKLVVTVLKELADHFNNSVVKVDTIVFNASRITKVPGTIAYKGIATQTRPYRMARVMS
jgi:hypothetical protein